MTYTSVPLMRSLLHAPCRTQSLPRVRLRILCPLRRIRCRPVTFLWFTTPLISRSPSSPPEWWACLFLHSSYLAFTFCITTNFPCVNTCLVILPWSAEWMNIGWLFAPLAEYLQGFFSLYGEGLFETLAKYFRGHVTFLSVHCAKKSRHFT